MNPLLSAKTNPSFLSFNQLKPHCGRLYNILVNTSAHSQREKIRLEQQLWAEVKLLRNFKDPNLLTYLIGFYHSILYQIAKEPSIHDLFQYNILIRLGDLNRYRQCDKVAEYYYSNARNIFPLFGHAYNQLALILAKPEILPENYYKCCYYYARAAKSSDKSLASLAESNLRIAARVYDGDILFKLLNGDTEPLSNGCIDNDDSGESEPRKSRKLFNGAPRAPIDWFYVMVIAIYADNIQSPAKLFLDFMRENFSTQRSTLMTPRNARQTSIYCDKDGYLLLASLDIFLDWLKLGSQGEALLPMVAGQLRKMRTCFQSTLASIKYEFSISREDNSRELFSPCLSPIELRKRPVLGINDITNSSRETATINLSDPNLATSHASSGSSLADQVALPHDHCLRGFKPLDQVHESITFCNHKKLVSMMNQRVVDQIEDACKKGLEEDESRNESFISLEQLTQILKRITSKMDGFGSCLKKKSRNIALESILANTNNA